MHPDEYHRLAAVEDRHWYFRSLRARTRAALVLAGLPAGAKVLDAGCGTGGTMRELRAWRGDLVVRGLDLSPIACDLARQAGLEAAQGSIEALPFADESFDALVSHDVLQQVESPLLALVEFFRCLKPGGVLVINAAALPWLWSYHDECVQSRRRFLASDLRGFVREAGFATEFCTHWNCLLLPLVVLRRKVFRPRDGASDVRPPWPPANAVCGAIAALERLAARIRLPLPLGSSIHLVARKPARVPRIRLQ